MRGHTRDWETPNKQKIASGYSFAVLAPYSKQRKGQERNGKEWKGSEQSKTGKSL